tara:strand:- start:35 stop:1015 length:981 start_codon:yes stop_codon:yes gene_type:complete
MTKLVISSGDPAGIGPDICIKAFGQKKKLAYTPIIIGDPEVFERRAKLLNLPLEIKEYNEKDASSLNRNSLLIDPFYVKKRVKPGCPDPSNAAYLMEILEQATYRTMKGEFNGLVTGPISKETINKGGINFPGHTEILAKLSKTSKVVMMLASSDLRVALATTHVPLKKVTKLISKKLIKDCLCVLNQSLKTQWKIKTPLIKVLGLNPHAGDGGFLGDEDKKIISPVITELKTKGFNLVGPLSADTAFHSEKEIKSDAILAMYHDQGLPVLKTLSFGKIINITLGLPFIRTSVDHGTAYDMVGKKEVDENSLLEASNLASRLAEIN